MRSIREEARELEAPASFRVDPALDRRRVAFKLRGVMKNSFLVFLAVVACLLPAAAQQPASGALGVIERLDPALDKLIPPGAVIEKLAEGFDWSEGPVWMPSDGCVLFSDVPRNTVYKWKAGAGVSVFLKPSGYTGPAMPGQREPGSNGLTLDANGHLVLCEHGDRRVARLEKDGRKTTLAGRFEGKRLNSPNDLVFKSNGDLYFTDPPYGLPKLNNDPAKELPFNGVYRLAKDGTLTLLTKEMTFPNGLAFSPDEKTLYVANSDPQRAIWMAFDVKPDGTLANGRVFFDATPLRKGRKGLPDGMKVDARGNLFATGPGGVLVFAPDGKHLGTLNTGEATANCAWDDDGSTLYITADMFLCRVKTTTKGKRF
jgi:gluconolactonase